MKAVLICVFVLLAIVIITANAETETENGAGAAEEKQDTSEDDISPLQDQDYTEKDHSKRTLFNSGGYDSYGLAKHVKLRNGQKFVIGYTPVDLKYVPVIKHLRNGWRFKPKPMYRPRPMWQMPIRPKPDNQEWKPIVPAHVPPPQAWQNQGWSKPTVTVLKPIRPSAPDHHHHDVHYDHHHDVHDDQHTLHHVHQEKIPQVLEVPHVDLPEDLFHRDIYGHYDLNHVHLHPPVPQQQFMYYSHPLVHVAKPNLGVLPLGARFPVPVAPIALNVPLTPPVPVVQTATHHYHPTPALVQPGQPGAYHPQLHFIPSVAVQSAFVPQTQAHYHSTSEVVHEVPAPHFHPTQVVPHQVFPHIPHFHTTSVPLVQPTVPVPHYDYQHDYHHNYHHDYHFPQVHEHPVDPPQAQPGPTPLVTVQPQGHSIEYHGHLAHLIQQNHNAHQYIPENYNPDILPGSTGTLSPGFLNPGITDLQIPEHLPDHPNYSVKQATEAPYYHQGHQGGYLPEGILQPAHTLDPPFNK